MQTLTTSCLSSIYLFQMFLLILTHAANFFVMFIKIIISATKKSFYKWHFVHAMKFPFLVHLLSRASFLSGPNFSVPWTFSISWTLISLAISNLSLRNVSLSWSHRQFPLAVLNFYSAVRPMVFNYICLEAFEKHKARRIH